MLIHGLSEASRVNGPGLRAVVFLRGCRLACADCWNPKSHRFDGDKRSVREIAKWAVSCRTTAGITGVTLSGGEPMHQAAELVPLVSELIGDPSNLSFGIFSGYSERELEAGAYWTLAPTDAESRRALWNHLRARLDFAALGRYNKHLRTLRQC